MVSVSSSGVGMACGIKRGIFVIESLWSAGQVRKAELLTIALVSDVFKTTERTVPHSEAVDSTQTPKGLASAPRSGQDVANLLSLHRGGERKFAQHQVSGSTHDVHMHEVNRTHVQ